MVQISSNHYHSRTSNRTAQTSLVTQLRNSENPSMASVSSPIQRTRGSRATTARNASFNHQPIDFSRCRRRRVRDTPPREQNADVACAQTTPPSRGGLPLSQNQSAGLGGTRLDDVGEALLVDEPVAVLVKPGELSSHLCNHAVDHQVLLIAQALVEIHVRVHEVAVNVLAVHLGSQAQVQFLHALVKVVAGDEAVAVAVVPRERRGGVARLAVVHLPHIVVGSHVCATGRARRRWSLVPTRVLQHVFGRLSRSRTAYCVRIAVVYNNLLRMRSVRYYRHILLVRLLF
mmetsp:Transcript_40435/g.77266  ORF Transcript_40435/g.77266 Transcript_40435/m.77266 type:complete len:288 (-) Transcript_40435:281-1144(-)